MVLPALVIAPFLLLTRRLGLIRQMQLGWGVLILLVLVSPWYILMSLRNEGYLSYFLIEKTLGSFTSEESSHPAPWHFYIPVLLGALLPWSSFLPVAIYRAWQRLAGDRREPMLYLLLWLGMMFLFFSAARSKLVTYLLPLMPAAAFLIGLVWAEALSSPPYSRQRLLLWSHIPTVVVVIAGCIYVWLNPPVMLEVKYGITQTQISALLAIIVVGAGLALWFLIRGRNGAAFGSIVVGVMGGLALFATWIGPTMDPYRSTREMALKFDQMLPPGKPMVFYWREKDSGLFYTDRDGVVLPTWEVGDYLSSDEAVFFVSDIRHLHRIEEHRDKFAFVSRIGDKVMVSNRPETEQLCAVPEGWDR
jgi:4-amino-4-deoxy-L-arabinose transferase-like glycosyltransferase